MVKVNHLYGIWAQDPENDVQYLRYNMVLNIYAQRKFGVILMQFRL